MNINATIIGQFITFAILVWFTMKYIWPPVQKTMHAREKKIADGLLAAERSRRELEMAEHKALAIIKEAKIEAAELMKQANQHAASLIDEAKAEGKSAYQRIIDMAQADIDREVMQAKIGLKNKLAALAVQGAEKIIRKQLNEPIQDHLLDELVEKI
jgi:F-type H+-transporting ATPase subunit b